MLWELNKTKYVKDLEDPHVAQSIATQILEYVKFFPLTFLNVQNKMTKKKQKKTNKIKTIYHTKTFYYLKRERRKK